MNIDKMQDSVDKADIADFYDGFLERLLNDFYKGNARVKAALQFAIHRIPASASRILDIGCGIGWSTYELKRHFPDAQITGIDISPELVDMAQQLFAVPKLRFKTAVVPNDRISQKALDAIVMIDVYEHIPVSDRAALHGELAGALSENGCLLLAYPSPSHQRWNQEHEPHLLQAVDEIVSFQDLLTLASSLEGELVHYSYASIWRPNDYIHAMIVRGRVGYRPQTEAVSGNKVQLMNRLSRLRKIKSVKPDYPASIWKEAAKRIYNTALGKRK